jgi:hypothetical protein
VPTQTTTSHPARLALLLAPVLAVAAPLGAGDAATPPPAADPAPLGDALEDALLDRFAPVVLLHPSEPARPSSAEWLLARSEIEPPGRAPRVLAASVLGVLASFASPAEDPRARLRPVPAALRGDVDPRAWRAYGHAYRGAGGGVLLQYWFLYPMNAGYGLFDHEGDWEHVTVRLGADLRPEGAHYARHHDSAPGPWFPWSALAREGDHPVVLAARGTHASYASPGEAPIWDRVCGERDPGRAAADGCTVWRTAGSVVNMGERSAPRVGFLAWPGRWGATGRFGEDSADAAPPGPAFQAGWCAGGAPGACR